MIAGATSITDDAGLAMIDQARRAILFLSVDWSMPERVARVRFQGLIQRLNESHPATNILFFTLEEDSELALGWLSNRVAKHYGSKKPSAIGAGSVGWFENGRLLRWNVSGHQNDLFADTLRAFEIG